MGSAEVEVHSIYPDMEGLGRGSTLPELPTWVIWGIRLGRVFVC